MGEERLSLFGVDKWKFWVSPEVPAERGGGNTQLLLDRFQCWWVAKYVLKRSFVPKERKRNGIFISVSGRDRLDYFESAKKIVKILFANIEVTYAGELFYPRVDKKGEILDHPTAINEALTAGENLVAAG